MLSFRLLLWDNPFVVKHKEMNFFKTAVRHGWTKASFKVMDLSITNQVYWRYPATYDIEISLAPFWSSHRRQCIWYRDWLMRMPSYLVKGPLSPNLVLIAQMTAQSMSHSPNKDQVLFTMTGVWGLDEREPCLGLIDNVKMKQWGSWSTSYYNMKILVMKGSWILFTVAFTERSRWRFATF